MPYDFVSYSKQAQDSMCCSSSLSHVCLFVIPWTAAHQAPLSMGILQARILEWVDLPSSRGSSQLRGQTQVSPLQADSLPSEPPGKPENTGVGSLSLSRGSSQPGIELGFPVLQADSLPARLPGKPPSEFPHYLFVWMMIFFNDELRQ